MANYCVTFRIANSIIGGKTYADRYQQLLQNVRSDGMGFWEETTSFFLAESNLNTDDFAKNACRGLSATHDMVFIFDPSDMSACYFGSVEHVDVLRSFFPRLKKTP